MTCSPSTGGAVFFAYHFTRDFILKDPYIINESPSVTSMLVVRRMSLKLMRSVYTYSVNTQASRVIVIIGAERRRISTNNSDLLSIAEILSEEDAINDCSYPPSPLLEQLRGDKEG